MKFLVGFASVNIKHPDMTDTVTGTELDGILAPGGGRDIRDQRLPRADERL